MAASQEKQDATGEHGGKKGEEEAGREEGAGEDGPGVQDRRNGWKGGDENKRRKRRWERGRGRTRRRGESRQEKQIQEKEDQEDDGKCALYCSRWVPQWTGRER